MTIFLYDYIIYLTAGISRGQRWERAKLHGLNPPGEIKDLLWQTRTDPEYNLRYHITHRLTFLEEVEIFYEPRE